MHQPLSYAKNIVMAKESHKVKHHYGTQVHILQDIYLSTLLARLGHPETLQPQVNQYLTRCYDILFARVLAEQFPHKSTAVDTRMKQAHPKEGVVHGEFLIRSTPAVCVSLARAGILPSHLGYELLNYTLNPSKVRQDHIYASRMVNENNEVTGTSFQGSKIGGDIQGAVVILPDPMGATGGTVVEAVNYYKKHIPGTALKFVAVHLIVTPEYIRNVTTSHPDVIIYGARLDRGLSEAKALAAEPGQYWQLEKGLNDNQYIVPGAGGLGEVMNNSFV